jgi:hypothetical protein
MIFHRLIAFIALISPQQAEKSGPILLATQIVNRLPPAVNRAHCLIKNVTEGKSADSK